MSCDARSLYVQLKQRYNRKEQKAVYLSRRTAAKELGANKDTVGVLYPELRHFGFIVQVQAARFGAKAKPRAIGWPMSPISGNRRAWISPAGRARFFVAGCPTEPDRLSDRIGQGCPTGSDRDPNFPANHLSDAVGQI
jgi:hypothetical protein